MHRFVQEMSLALPDTVVRRVDFDCISPARLVINIVCGMDKISVGLSFISGQNVLHKNSEKFVFCEAHSAQTIG